MLMMVVYLRLNRKFFKWSFAYLSMKKKLMVLRSRRKFDYS